MGYTLVPLPPYRPERLNVSVREATSGSDRRRAAALHWRINRGDRYWIAPPRGERQRALSARHNADLERIALGVFIAEARSTIQADQVVGSMAVWVADGPEDNPAARFGLFEVINEPDVAERLIEAAEMWLLEQFPVAAIRGPYSLDGRQPPGLLTGGFNVRPAPQLPYNPPYYPEMIERVGYAPCQTARTYLLPARASADPPQVRVIASAPDQRAGIRFSLGVNHCRDIGVEALADFSVSARDRLPALPARPGKPLLQQDAPSVECAQRAIGAGAGFCVIWEEGGEALDAMIVTPDPGGSSPRLARRLLHPLAQRPSGRLYAHSAADVAVPGWDDRRLALCRAVAAAAARLGYEEVLLGPIPDEEERILVALSARPAHTFQVFEKEF